MFFDIRKNTTPPIPIIAATKISALVKSMVNAINMAPNTTKGLLRKSLKNIFTPVWTLFTSLVILVIMVLVPTSSISGYDRFIRCLKSTSLNLVAKPIAAFAEKYCAVIATAHPTIASTNRTTIIR